MLLEESPLHPFELHEIIPISLFGFDISINKAVIWMWIVVALVSILLIVAACYGLFGLIVRSPLGVRFMAVRENDRRAALVGINVYLTRYVAFVLAGGLAGASGALFAFFGRYASASYMFYHVSGEAVVWAIGRTRPNTGWVPAEILDEDGFVRAGLDLAVPGVDGVFAIGDVAATDPLRSSARNFTFTLLARNVRAHLEGRPLKTFQPPKRRWGSVTGYQDNGLTVFTAAGRRFRIPRLPVDRMVRARVVDRGYYRGVRR